MSSTPNRPDPALYRGVDDLVHEFTSTGWDGDLKGALEEAPFAPPVPDRGRSAHDWRPFFKDYLRDLPEDIRTKYQIRRPRG